MRAASLWNRCRACSSSRRPATFEERIELVLLARSFELRWMHPARHWVHSFTRPYAREMNRVYRRPHSGRVLQIAATK